MSKTEAVVDQQRPPVDVEAILNRHRVNLARDQNLVEKWFPLSKAERKQRDEKQAQPQGTLLEAFFRPELAGLGSDLSTAVKLGSDGVPTGGSGEIERLRKQMLGRRTAPLKTGSNHHRNTNQTADSHKPWAGLKRPNVSKPDESDSDEEGRAESFKSKHPKKPKAASAAKALSFQTNTPDPGLLGEADPGGTVAKTVEDLNTPAPEPQSNDESSDASADDSPKAKSKLSVLDQVLAKRKEKKKRKRRKKSKQET